MEGEIHQGQRRHDEADDDRDQAYGEGDPAPDTAQPHAVGRARTARRHDEAALPPGGAFDPQQGEDEDQHHRRDLSCPAEISLREPCGIDTQRQCAHAEEAGGANVVDAFHQREAYTNGDGRPGQRQRHAAEGAPGRLAQRARHFHLHAWLADEARPRGEEDIGIEHHRQHNDGAAHGADFGEPVVGGRLPAEEAAQPGLYGACVAQQVDIGIGDDVARHRHGHERGPLKYPPERKAAGRDQPRNRRSDNEGDGADACKQQRGLPDVTGQNGGNQMRPDVLCGRRGKIDDGDDRQRQQPADDQRSHAQEAAAGRQMLAVPPPGQARLRHSARTRVVGKVISASVPLRGSLLIAKAARLASASALVSGRPSPVPCASRPSVTTRRKGSSAWRS